MKVRLSHILIVLGALVAFLPVLAVDFVLDRYVAGHETARLEEDAAAIADETQYAVYSGIAAIGSIRNDSPSLCTPTFLDNVAGALQRSVYLKQVLVANRDGVQYCDGYDTEVDYTELSRELSVPGNDATVRVVQMAGEDMPSLMITQLIGSNRTMSAFVHVSPRLVDGLPDNLADAALLTMKLTSGADIVTLGDSTIADQGGGAGDYLHARAVAEALPLAVEIYVPFDAVRAEYGDLDLMITLAAAAMGAAFLILALHYLRNARLPAYDIERAINNGEIEPHYQPIMNTATGELAGCEVLVRWRKRDGKLVSPGVFIDYAEASGLALPMTLKIMERVRDDLAEVCAEVPDLKVGINLFEGHFRDTRIVEDVQAIFEGSALGYRQLVFEITERRPLQNQHATSSVLGGLHALGCRIALDDAGTGHSNLEYMQTLGIDILKIDRVFVDMISEDVESVPILDGLIDMASNIGLDVVAEGVETETQAIYLRRRGVYEAQGFLFAPALARDSFVELAKALNVTEAEPSSIDAASQALNRRKPSDNAAA